MSLQPGEKLGPYEILAPIGAGGMGGVYRARDSKLNREVAIQATCTEVMFTNLMPMVESAYRALAGKENRARAGLSMGGLQTFQTTLQNLDEFAYIGGFSPGLPQATIGKFIFGNPAEFNRPIKLLWIGTGTIEGDNNPNILRLHEALEKARGKHVYYESPGTAHEWLTWRRDLNEFAPLLFR